MSPITSGAAFVAVSCPTTSWCAAVDAAGLLWWSTSPASTDTWTATSASVDDAAISGLACPSPDQCLVSDLAGAELATSSVSSSTVWTSTALASGEGISALSCTPSGGCVAAAFGGAVLRSEDPLDPTPTWATSAVLPVTPTPLGLSRWLMASDIRMRCVEEGQIWLTEVTC